MYCGQCCVTEARLRDAPRLDIFIEILLGTWVNGRVAAGFCPRERFGSLAYSG
jgi:hypothetical protein